MSLFERLWGLSPPECAVETLKSAALAAEPIGQTGKNLLSRRLLHRQIGRNQSMQEVHFLEELLVVCHDELEQLVLVFGNMNIRKHLLLADNALQQSTLHSFRQYIVF